MPLAQAFHLGRIRYSPGASLGPRPTLEFEFVRILQGDIQWTYDGRTHDLGPGHFILSQPDHTEHYRWDTRAPTVHDYMHFRLTDEPTHLPPPATWAVVKRVEAGDILHALFEHIINLKTAAHPAADRMTDGALRQMLDAWTLDLHRFKDAGFEGFSMPVQRVFDGVLQRWQNQRFAPPTIDEMVRMSQVSRSTFLRAFKEQCADSPIRFFENQRLCLAQLDMLQTDYNIDQIAYRLQYPNPFQFSRNFKQRFGLSPKHYRAAGADAPAVDLGYVAQSTFTKLASARLF